MKKPTAKEYREAEMNLIMTYAPDIYACGKCKWPVRDGYCCGYCGDTNPSDDKRGKEVRPWK